jgi:cyclophilin family peptidyl-prolyl cis-trans isomerase
MCSCTSTHKGVRTFLFSLFALAFTSAVVAAPNAPTYLAAYAFDATRVVLLWNDNSSDETGFEIFQNGTSLGVTPVNWTDVLLTNSAGLSAVYEVRAVNGSGSSAFAPSVTCTQATFNAPGSLNNLLVGNSILITWADNAITETGFEIETRKLPSDSFTVLGSVGANTTVVDLNGYLDPGTSYEIRVRARTGTGPPYTYTGYSNTTTLAGFTSPSFITFGTNNAYSYQATTTTAATRTSWNAATGLPSGMSFSTTTGQITGTPTQYGLFTATLSATFSNGWTATMPLKLRVVRPPAVPITATTINAQTLSSGGNTSIGLTDKFSDPDSESAVRVVTNLGTMDFILFNTATPQTVTNFLSYVNAATNNYNGSVFHRSIPGFVVQGGSFKVASAPNNFSVTTTSASPLNEPGISNLRGTVAMAKVGGNPNSATNSFFVNVGNNSSNLDGDSGSPNANGGFTAFARVAGNGMNVADAINGLPTSTYSVNFDGSPQNMGDWPLTSASGSMDTTKVVLVTSAAPVAVLSYSVTGNTNPSAVSASISGTNVQINGVAGGQSNVTVTATDLDGNAVEQTFAVTVNQAPVFTNGPPPDTAVVGTAYNFVNTASGFPAPAFSHTGTLPPGLSLSSTGVLSGTPTQTGEYTGIVVTASNGIGTAATQNVSITVHQKPAISSNAAPAGILGIGYSHTFTATGSPAPTFSTTDPLPTGLTLSPAGVLSGTPSAIGTFAGTVTATNVAGTSEQAFNIVINQQPAFTNGPPPASGTVGTAYSFSYTASGSPAPTFALTSGALPAGLSLNPSGAISGTPTTAGGPFTGTVTASNGIGTAATQDFSITVAKGTATVTLDDMTLTQTYDGTPKSVTASSTPGGLTIDITYNGSASAPTSHGSHAVLAVVNDSNYNGSASGTLLIQGQSMSNWRTQYFSPEQITAGLADDDSDPDGDGWKNLVEYALGMNPMSRNPALLPVRDANGLTLTFTRPKDMPDVTYGAQSTDNLDGWDALTLEIVTDGPVQTLRARDPLTSGNPSRRFLQLIFDRPPSPPE